MTKWVRVLLGIVASVISAIACANVDADVSESVATSRDALTTIVSNDFEDGTLQGWIPRGTAVLTNTTESAVSGTHSLKTTGRTAGFNGPSLNVLPIFARGATYQISVQARLAPGEVPTTLRMTVQQTPAGGSNQFITVAQNSSATDAGWVTLTGTFSYNVSVTGLLLYVEATSATASYYIDDFSITETIPAPAVNIQNDWEDGTQQGWIPRGPVTLANTTEIAADGTHSLKTTGRTAGFNGPSLNVLGTLRKGATYGVSVKVRLVAGTPATTLRVTVQRTPTGGSNQFDSIAQNTNVTDAAWVTLSGLYTFNTDVTGLLLYVESTSATASYYIDTFSLVELAPPATTPANTTGAAAGFESNTREGWFSRTGSESVNVTNADAHTGSFSLVTTGRTQSFHGPAFDVTNVMFNGSRYHVSLWIKLTPGQPDTTLRVSLERKLGSFTTTFHTLIGNQTVTAGSWVRFVTTFDDALAATQLTLYVESNGGAPLSSFMIDDFQINFVPPAVAERDIPSVYQTLAPFFRVGAAINTNDLSGEHAVLLTKHFNSVTSENDMKWSALEPTEGSFTFGTADSEIAFAIANGMHARGHTLIWHNQNPAWLFNDASGNPMTPTSENKALLLARLENHIRTVVSHFGDKVYAWDVVNEVIDPAESDGFRRSPWFTIIGPEYIDRAFQVAREVAPNAQLFINDFGTTSATKRQFLYDLVRDLKSRGIPVDGIGHQMHNNVDFPSGQDIVDTVNLFDSLGIKNEITELDVSIYSGSFPGPVADYFDIPSDRLVKQGYRYRAFFQAFEQLHDKIQAVTLWGQADDHTWLASPSRTDAPLLFDVSLKKKNAYWGVIDPFQLPGADLRTSVTAGASSAEVGQTIAYTIQVDNVGDEDTQPYQPADDDLPAANVSVVSTVPAGTLFQSLTAPDGWACTTPVVGGTGQIRCTTASLAVNGSATFDVSVVSASCATPDGSAVVIPATATSETPNPNPSPVNSASATVTLSNPAPIVTLNGPPEMSVECRASFVDPGATALDACQGGVDVTTSGSVNTDQVGRYLLSYGATDAAGSAATPVSRSVSVVDTTAPSVTVVGDLVVTLECQASFADPGATALDACAGILSVTTSGSVSSAVPSTSLLAYFASDPSGNSSTATRSVNRVDTIAPVFNPVDLTVLIPGAKIVVDGQTLVVNGQSFPLTKGTVVIMGHTITFDGANVIIDGTTFTPDGNTVLLLSPLHQYQSFTIADFIAAVTDCDATLGVDDVVVDRVTSDEPEDAPGGGDGNTREDIVIAPDCHGVNLRVERNSTGNGRVYTVTLRVRDASGNTSLKAVKVLVPVNRTSATAVDDGPRYTVAGACP